MYNLSMRAVLHGGRRGIVLCLFSFTLGGLGVALSGGSPRNCVPRDDCGSGSLAVWCRILCKIHPIRFFFFDKDYFVVY